MRSIEGPLGRRRRPHGQALVEFAMVIPMFMTLFVAICEFTFLFSAYVSINFASHDGSQVAATLGATVGADTAVVDRINNDVMSPANPRKIVSIEIYWVDTSTTNATPMGGWSGSVNKWTYDGIAHPYTLPNGSPVTLPYTRSTNNYKETDRCNANLGINCASGHLTVDTIGVRITYQHGWITPFPGLVGGGPTGPQMQSINVMRLEPIQ